MTLELTRALGTLEQLEVDLRRDLRRTTIAIWFSGVCWPAMLAWAVFANSLLTFSAALLTFCSWHSLRITRRSFRTSKATVERSIGVAKDALGDR